MRTALMLFLVFGLAALSSCTSDEGDSGGGGSSGGATLVITTVSPPAGTAGITYNTQLLTSGGSGLGYAWAVTAGALPGGISLNPGTPDAQLAGVPSAAGLFNFTVEVTDSLGATANANLSINISPATLTINTSVLNAGTVGTAYQQLVGAAGGTGAYTWSVLTGNLPPGLSLINGTPDATIDGTPTTAGNYAFTLQVMDSASATDTQPFMLSIAGAPASLAINTTSLPNANVMTAYSQPIDASGGTQPYTWRIASGALSYGMSLVSGSPSATLSGMPRLTTMLNFTVEVEDAVGAIVQQAFSLTIQPGTLTIPAVTLDYAVEGFFYCIEIACMGGAGGGGWTISGGALPTGIILLSALERCVLMGTPTVSGTFLFSLEVIDSQTSTASRQFSLDVRSASGPLVIANQSFGPFAVNATPYGSALLATGGTASGYSWSFASGSQVPPGMNISTGPSALTGTLTQAGTYAVILQVMDSGSNVATRAFTIVVGDAPDCFGIPVRQSVVFLMDASASMSGTGVATMRAEVTSTLSGLTPAHEFDCVAFGGHFSHANGYTVMMWATLLPATSGNVVAATSWLSGSATNPGGGTPTYPAIQKICQQYPSTLESVFLITDGFPSTGGSAGQILADFPGWFLHFNDCHFNTVGLGTAAPIAFLGGLACLGRGAYVAP